MFNRVTFRTPSRKPDDEDTNPSLFEKVVSIRDNRMVTADYIIGEYLGSGKFGEVKQCEEKKSGCKFAAKFVPIASKEDMESVQNEIDIMNRLRHPRLIQLYDAYLYRNEVVMVLELITGGELFERIIDESFDLNESRCIRFMNEILQGVEYIHKQGVLHLDLKPENILCLSKSSFKTKIIDFGLARFYDGKELCVLFGTPEFVSPEVISYEPVTPAADMWSVGVICYVMLSGLSPFMGDSQSETLANILRVTYDFDYPEFDDISDYAKSFIRKLLVRDPGKRLTASQCLQDPWIKRKKSLKRKGTVNKKSLKHFVYRRKWQKAVNAIVALLRMGVVLHHPGEKSPDKLTTSELLQPISKSIPECKLRSPSNADRLTESISNKEQKKSGPYIKNTPKRSIGSESDSQASSQTNSSRRSSILSRLGFREGSSESTAKIKISIPTGKKDKKGNRALNAVKENLKLGTRSYNQSLLTEHDLNSSSKAKNVDRKESSKLTPYVSSSSTQKSTGQSSPHISSIKSDPSNTNNEQNPFIKTQRSVAPVNVKLPSNPKVRAPVRPAQKAVAPLTGGIAAKIGFFSNLSK